MNRLAFLAVLTALSSTWVGCLGSEEESDMTNAEALESLTQALTSGEGENVVTGVIEISTNFTIGSAIDAAVQELHSFLESQVDCSTATIQDATLTIDFGTLDDQCVYRGTTYAGTAASTVVRNDEGEVQVEHVWTELSNGRTEVSGTGTVTWSAADMSRRVVHQLDWTKNSVEWVASGDRTQTLVDATAGIEAGIQIDGVRSWSNERGDWVLAIDSVSFRLADPIPFAGQYSVTTPDDKVLTISFTEIDDDTIQARLSGTRRDWIFNVSGTGAVELQDEETSS